VTVTATIHTPPPEPQPDRRVVTLTMPYDVAVTLRAMLGSHVIGEFDGTYREHTRHLYSALAEAVPTAGRRFDGKITALPTTHT